MQAITVAIGKQGIEYFSKTVVATQVVARLEAAGPPDRLVPVHDITQVESQRVAIDISLKTTYKWSDIEIKLTKGEFENFEPEYKGVKQIGEQFEIDFESGSFAVEYNWQENYQYSINGKKKGDYENEFPHYRPTFKFLNINALLEFNFNQDNDTYQLLTKKDDNESATKDANIPSQSVIQEEDKTCFSTEVSKATAEMVSNIDFSETINQVFPDLFASISASGRLTDSIRFDFAVATGTGENGLQFPNNPDSPVQAGKDGNGITIGVTGAVQWRNDAGEWQYYPGDNQPIPLLPVPRVPDDNDKHYLNIYVSNYEINALYWAYFKSGGLDKLVTPESLPDPDLLNTSTYVELVPAFEQYDGDAMYAEISPIEAPINSFQKVYEFTSDALDKLEGAVPEDVFKKVKSKLQGKVFDSKTALQDKLKHYHIEEQYFETIEKASERLGLVTRQNVELKLVIQDEENNYPYLTFDVSIVDLLTDLKLAIKTVYEVTEKNIEELKIAGIPENCLDALENLKNSVYRCEKNFVKALENNLNKSEFEPYLPEILTACARTLQTMTFDYK